MSTPADHFLNSQFREKIIEYVFIGDCLRSLWAKGFHDAEILRADVDAGGYDLVMEVAGILRHVQLKSSFNGAKTNTQKINARLGEKPSGCVVWMGFHPETIKLGPFLWFGNGPGEPLPDITGLRKGKHSKGNSEGVKAERRNTFVLNRGDFETLETLDDVLHRLFGV